MAHIKKNLIFNILSFGLIIPSYGQLQLEWIDTTTQMEDSFMYFFTNRPPIISDSGQLSFQDKYQHGTFSLTFGNYYLEEDSFVIKYKAKQSAEEGAIDYFLFHHLLSSMMRDTSFMNNISH